MLDAPFGARVPFSRLRCTALVLLSGVLLDGEAVGVGSKCSYGDATMSADPNGVDLAVFEECVHGGPADGQPAGCFFDGEQCQDRGVGLSCRASVGRLPGGWWSHP